MNASIHQGTPQHTAKIYQFPVRSRKAGGEYRGGPNMAEQLALSMSSAIETCWYHGEAVKESIGPSRS
jgi:hypothetical protein